MAEKGKKPEAETIIGYCAYCGQSGALSTEEAGAAKTEAEADEMVTASCTCDVARAARKLEELFSGQPAEAVEIVKQAAKLVFAHRTEGLTYKFTESIKVAIYRTKKGKLVVKRTITNAQTAQF